MKYTTESSLETMMTSDDLEIKDLLKKSKEELKQNWQGEELLWKRIQQEVTPSPRSFFTMKKRLVMATTIALMVVITIVFMRPPLTYSPDEVFTYEDYVEMLGWDEEISEFDTESVFVAYETI